MTGAIPAGGRTIGSSGRPVGTDATWWRRNSRTLSFEECLALIANKTRRTRRQRGAAAPVRKDVRPASCEWRRSVTQLTAKLNSSDIACEEEKCSCSKSCRKDVDLVNLDS
ncbi:hypothetical protein Syun_019221 [Stephania yunnanensis]|uniref:Uncharacterized protein n=1 Tax=Stephania yunnanensis TaxID=152371 RepID=A0AAP0ITR0_9MAGN